MGSLNLGQPVPHIAIRCQNLPNSAIRAFGTYRPSCDFKKSCWFNSDNREPYVLFDIRFENL